MKLLKVCFWHGYGNTSCPSSLCLTWFFVNFHFLISQKICFLYNIHLNVKPAQVHYFLRPEAKCQMMSPLPGNVPALPRLTSWIRKRRDQNRKSSGGEFHGWAGWFVYTVEVTILTNFPVPGWRSWNFEVREKILPYLESGCHKGACHPVQKVTASTPAPDCACMTGEHAHYVSEAPVLGYSRLEAPEVQYTCTIIMCALWAS